MTLKWAFYHQSVRPYIGISFLPIIQLFLVQIRLFYIAAARSPKVVQRSKKFRQKVSLIDWVFLPFCQLISQNHYPTQKPTAPPLMHSRFLYHIQKRHIKWSLLSKEIGFNIIKINAILLPRPKLVNQECLSIEKI